MVSAIRRSWQMQYQHVLGLPSTFTAIVFEDSDEIEVKIHHAISHQVVSLERLSAAQAEDMIAVLRAAITSASCATPPRR